MIQRLCSKSSKIIFSSTWTENFQIFRLDSKKTDDQIANIHWIIEKAREFQKKIYFCPIDSAKAFDCVDHNHLWNILKEMGIPDQFSCLLRNLHAGQEATVEQDMEQRNGNWFKIRKEILQGWILSPCLFKLYAEYIIWSSGWMTHKMQLRLQREISTTSDSRWYHFNDRNWRGTKEPVDAGETGDWKRWLKV